MIEINNLSFRYEGTAQGVSGIHLNIRDGECVVLTGCSGCGKTTLTRLVNGLAPSFYPGEKSGTILLNGQDISELPVWKIGESVVSVFQNPKSQFFSSELAGEVAFACENYGFPQEEIRRRTDNAITVMGLDAVRNRPLDILSSGEKQRAAVASVYALCPKVFVCDEPTANLDEDGIVQLKETFCTLKKQGYTFLIAEHRLAWLDDLADRYIYMDDGVIDGEYSPSQMKAITNDERTAMGLRTVLPMSVPQLSAPLGERPFLKTKSLSARRGENIIWQDLNIEFFKGQVTAVTGKNGAGKTTLALILSGLMKQTEGEILIDGKKMGAAKRRKNIWYCSNDTGTQFFTDSVTEELLLNMPRTEDILEQARQLLKRMGLYEYKDVHPATLSGGQKQRLAIACGLLSERNILIFDEPTSGLDGKNMILIAGELKAAANSGKAIIVITHDAELMSSCCDCQIRVM